MSTYVKEMLFEYVKNSISTREDLLLRGVLTIQDALYYAVEDFIVDICQDNEDDYCSSKLLEYMKEENYDKNDNVNCPSCNS